MDGICIKCVRFCNTEKHHIIPRRVKRKRNVSTIKLCKDCHCEIEEILPKHRKLSKNEYLAIHFKWLKGYRPFVKDEECDVIGLA